MKPLPLSALEGLRENRMAASSCAEPTQHKNPEVLAELAARLHLQAIYPFRLAIEGRADVDVP